jgi:hypothetical protein
VLYGAVQLLAALGLVTGPMLILLVEGLVLGWGALFLFDSSKRIQSVLIVFVLLPEVAVLLLLQDRWTGIVFGYYNSVPNLLVLGLALAGGVITGLIKATNTTTIREFPTAARGLYAIIGGAVVVAIVDHALAFPGPVQFVTYLGVSLLFLAVVNLFTQYSDEQTVTLLSPDWQAEAMLLGSLFKTARQNGGTSTQRGRELNQLSATRERDAVPNVETPVGFSYRSDSLLAQKQNIVANGYYLTEHSDQVPAQLERLEQRADRRSKWYYRLGAMLGKQLVGLLPNMLRSDRVETAGRSLADVFDRSDVLLLALPLQAALTDDENSDCGYRLADAVQDDVDVFARLCALYADSPTTTVFVIAMDAERGMDAYERKHGVPTTYDDPAFLDFLGDLLGIDGSQLLAMEGWEAGATVTEPPEGGVAILRSI